MPQQSAISHASKALHGRCIIPGDKSISHRSLLFSALAVGESHVHGILPSDDIIATRQAIEQLGAQIIDKTPDMIVIHGVGNGSLLEPQEALNFGNSGTGARLTMGLVGSYDFATTFIGDSSLSRRPMGRVLKPLEEMGATILARSEGRLPLTIKGNPLAIPINYRLPVASAQIKSAILLAGLNIRGRTTVIEPIATRDHTEKMLHGFGIDVDIFQNDEGEKVISLIGEQELNPQKITIPGDPSSAAFLIVAALICPDSDIVLQNILLNPTRTGLIISLQEMGADISIENEKTIAGESVGDLHIRFSELKGIHIPAERAPTMIDEYPVLAIAASFAHGDTHMTGLSELRVKESDRLAAICDGLEKNGIEHQNGTDWLTVTGTKSVKGGGTVQTQMDHRIAMSFLVMGLASKNPITIDDTSMIATSFPNFVELMQSIGAHIILTDNDA